MTELLIWLAAFLYVAGATLALDLTTRACAMEGLSRPKWQALAVILVAWPLISVALSLHRVAAEK